MGIWVKYPNEHSGHITSVDVLSRTFLPDGTLRTERLIAIRQHAPRWIMKVVPALSLSKALVALSLTTISFFFFFSTCSSGDSLMNAVGRGRRGAIRAGGHLL
jgi:hypothetical protein